jgi:hypothetical protein
MQDCNDENCRLDHGWIPGVGNLIRSLDINSSAATVAPHEILVRLWHLPVASKLKKPFDQGPKWKVFVRRGQRQRWDNGGTALSAPASSG